MWIYNMLRIWMQSAKCFFWSYDLFSVSQYQYKHDHLCSNIWSHYLQPFYTCNLLECWNWFAIARQCFCVKMRIIFMCILSPVGPNWFKCCLLLFNNGKKKESHKEEVNKILLIDISIVTNNAILNIKFIDKLQFNAWKSKWYRFYDTLIVIVIIIRRFIFSLFLNNMILWY